MAHLRDKPEVIKAVLEDISKLEKRYSFDAVNRIVSKHFLQVKEQKKIEKLIQTKEKELELLKKQK